MYFDTDTLLKYTDLKFFVTRLLWICYLLYHCKTKVFIKLFIENKGFHWSLKNKRTNKRYPYLRAGKYHAKGPYHQPFHRVYPAFLKWWINALQTTLLKHVLGFRPLLPFVFLSEELRVPLAMLLFEEWKKKIKLTKRHFRDWIATVPHFSFCGSNKSCHVLAVLTSLWMMGFPRAKPLLYPPSPSSQCCS